MLWQAQKEDGLFSATTLQVSVVFHVIFDDGSFTTPSPIVFAFVLLPC